MAERSGPSDGLGHLRLQRWLLRFTAVMLFTGLPGVILPPVAIEKFSWMMGLGQPNLQPLTVYLGGNAGYAFCVLGVLVWVISNDVVRYRPLVITFGWVFLTGLPAYLLIDLQCPLPLWWVAMDTLSSLALGAAILWACRIGPNIKRGAGAIDCT